MNNTIANEEFDPEYTPVALSDVDDQKLTALLAHEFDCGQDSRGWNCYRVIVRPDGWRQEFGVFGAPSLVSIIRAAYRTFFDDQNRLLETDFKVVSGTQNDAMNAKIKAFEELGFRVELKPTYPEFSWLEWVCYVDNDILDWNNENLHMLEHGVTREAALNAAWNKFFPDGSDVYAREVRALMGKLGGE